MNRMVVAAVEDDVDELIERYFRAQGEFLRGNPEPVKALFSRTQTGEFQGRRPKPGWPENTDIEQEDKMDHFVVAKDDLPHSGSAHRFEGYLYGGADVSFFISDTPPGKGPSLHTHPYAEVFVVQEGELTFTVGGDTIEATGGQIVVAPAGAPHKFTNTGTGRARHMDIHTSARMDTTWLEEGA